MKELLIAGLALLVGVVVTVLRRRRSNTAVARESMDYLHTLQKKKAKDEKDKIRAEAAEARASAQAASESDAARIRDASKHGTVRDIRSELLDRIREHGPRHDNRPDDGAS